MARVQSTSDLKDLLVSLLMIGESNTNVLARLQSGDATRAYDASYEALPPFTNG
jgi:hypothetical protein